MFLFSVILTLAAVFLMFLLFYKEAVDFIKNRNNLAKPVFDDKKILGNDTNRKMLVLILFLVAILLRWWQLGEVPAGARQDSIMTAIDARALYEYGTDHWGITWPLHMKAWGHGHQSPMLAYLLALVFSICGESDFTLTIPNFIISIIGIFALYKLAREIWGDRAALLTLFVVAFNPWHFMQSRWALDCNLFPHIFIVGLWLLMKGIDRKKYIYISMVFFALCHYSYAVSLYIVPVFLLGFCGYLLHKKLVSFKTVLISALIYIILAMPFYVTMFSIVFKLPEIKILFFTIPAMQESVRASDVLFFSDHPARQLISNFISIINTVAVQRTDALDHTVPTFGNIHRFLFPFTLLGAYYLFRLIKNVKGIVGNGKMAMQDVQIKGKYMGIFLYLTVAFMSGLITANVNTYRINIIYYGQILMIVLGVLFLKKYSEKFYRATVIAIAVMSLVFIGTYFTSFAREWIDAGFSYHYKTALRYTAEFDCPAYYIVCDSRNISYVAESEAYTIYTHGLDVPYIQGRSDFVGKDIKRRLYEEQYHYVWDRDMVNMDIEPQSVYMVNDIDESLLPDELFEKRFFGQYCVGIPREIYETYQQKVP